MQNTIYLLKQWGIWATQGVNVNGYISPTFLILKANVQQTNSTANITDDQAMQVDRAISKLKKEMPTVAQIIILYYCYQSLTVRKLADTMKTSTNRINQLLKIGEGFIHAKLTP